MSEYETWSTRLFSSLSSSIQHQTPTNMHNVYSYIFFILHHIYMRFHVRISSLFFKDLSENKRNWQMIHFYRKQHENTKARVKIITFYLVDFSSLCAFGKNLLNSMAGFNVYENKRKGKLFIRPSATIRLLRCWKSLSLKPQVLMCLRT
jgi:hypothetical protein